MAIKWETVKAGDRLYDVHSYRMGNTTMRSVGVWDVRIVQVSHDAGWARVSWNGNPEEVWRRGRVEKLRRKKPELERSVSGVARVKRRAPKSATPTPAEGE